MIQIGPLRILPSAILLLCSLSAESAVLFQDDFESGNLEKSVNGHKWNGPGGMTGEVPKITSDISRSGSKSLQFTFLGKPSGEDSWSEQRFKFGRNISEVYLRYYLYYPNGKEGLGAKYVHRTDKGANNNKFFRMWDDHYSKFNIKVGFSSLPSGSSSYIIPEKGLNQGGTGNFDMRHNNVGIDERKLGRWIEILMHIKTDDGSGNGVLELSVDGKTVANLHNVKLHPRDRSKNYFRNAYFLGWAASGFSKTTHVYMDDLTISDTPIDGTNATALFSPPRSPLITIK